MVGKIKRVGNDFDKLVNSLQDNLAPIVGKRPSYVQVTNSMGQFLIDERTHERMIRRAAYLASQRRNRGLF